MTHPTRPDARRVIARAAGAALCLTMTCLTVTACSSGAAKAHTGSPRPPSSSAPAAQPSTGPAAQAAVTSMWQTFFNGAVPIPRRLGLLQNGQKFAPFVTSQAKTSLGALVLAASAKVSSVTLNPPAQATVIYTILLGGKPIAKNQSGTAVYDGGRWQVADTTFCSLLHVAYGKKPKLIPAACGS
jgi:hypothetical protein